MKKTDIEMKGELPIFKFTIHGIYDKESVTLLSNNYEDFISQRKKLWEDLLGCSPPLFQDK